MKHIVLLAALLAPYCVLASTTGSFEFDIPQQAKDKAAKDKSSGPIKSNASITVVKPDQVKVASEPVKPRVSVVMPVPGKPAAPVQAKPALPTANEVAKSTQQPSTPVAKASPAPATNKAAAPGPVGKEVYRTEEVSKNSGKTLAKAGKLCTPMTVAMTFHNVPTQKGPYFHRWVSLGCEADEVNFVREGNEQYSMNWQLSYVPADEHQTARYALRWKIKGNDDKGAPVDHEARHTFNLDNARTLSLTNNMAVSLRKVP